MKTTHKTAVAFTLFTTLIAASAMSARADGPMVPAPKLPPPSSLAAHRTGNIGARTLAPRQYGTPRAAALSDGSFMAAGGRLLYKSGRLVRPVAATAR